MFDKLWNLNGVWELCIRLVASIYSMKPLKRPIRVAGEFVFGI